MDDVNMADTFWVGPEADPEAPDAVHALVRQPLCQTGDAGSALPGLCRIAGAACTNLQTCNRKRGMQVAPMCRTLACHLPAHSIFETFAAPKCAGAPRSHR